MSLSRLIATASFRLAATYLAIFTASVIVLGAVIVYFSVGRELAVESDARVVAETASLRDFFSTSMASERLAEVAARARRRRSRPGL